MLPLVLVVMAVQAEQFPVAAVGGIVLVVVIAVMHGQLAQVAAVELAGAAAADPGIDIQGLLPISLFAGIGRASCIGDDAVEFFGRRSGHADYFSCRRLLSRCARLLDSALLISEIWRP